MVLRLICLLTLLATTLAAWPASVAARQSEHTGLDVIFLADQSGTMGGKAFEGVDLGLENDALDLRFWAPLNAIDWLGRAYVEYGMRPPDYFRVGMIYFAKDAHRAFPGPGYVTIAPLNNDDWRAQYKTIASLVGPSKLAAESYFGSSFWCCTDLESALGEAKKLFSDMGTEETENRLRVIVLLSDGLPDPNNTNNYSAAAMSPYMDSLARYVKQNLPSSQYSIHVLAFNDSQNPYWGRVATKWSEITGDHARLVENNSTLGGDLQQALLGIVQPFMALAEEEISCGPLVVDPYLKEFHLTIHKPVASARIQVYDGSGALLTVDSTDTASPRQVNGQEVWLRGASTPIETVTIFNPRPGAWRLVCPSGQDVLPRVFRRSVPVDVRLTLSGGAAHQFVPLAVRLELLDNRGAILASYQEPSYALALSPAAQSQSGAEIPLSLTKEYTATEAYTGWIVPGLAEQIHLTVSCSSSRADGTRVDLARVAQSVTVRPSRLQLLPPDSGTTAGVPTLIRAVFVDQDGVPLPAAVETAQLSVQVLCLDNQGSPPLLTTLEDGMFEAQLVLMQVGSMQVAATGQFTQAEGTVLQIPPSPQVVVQVAAPEIVVSSMPQRLVERIPFGLALSVHDRAGRPLQESLAAGLRLQVDAEISGAQTSIFPMRRRDDGTYSVRVTPTEAVTHTLGVVITLVEERSGDSVEVLRRTLTAVPATALLDWLHPLLEKVAIGAVIALFALLLLALVYAIRSQAYSIPLRLEIKGKSGETATLTLSDKPRRQIKWKKPTARAKGFLGFDSGIEWIRVTHCDREMKEKRVVRVDVRRKNRKLLRSALLMMNDRNLEEERLTLPNGVKIRLESEPTLTETSASR